MTARRFLRLTHGWIGAILALFVVLVAGTGASLAFMSEMFLAQYGDVLRAEAPAEGQAPVSIDADVCLGAGIARRQVRARWAC